MNKIVRYGFSQFKGVLPATSHKPGPYTGPAYEQIVKDRATYMPGFYFYYYKEPLLIS